MIERIVVVGFPRSGTNFLTRLLAHYFDGPNRPTWDGNGLHHLVRKIHWEYQLADGAADIENKEHKLVYIVRDPRDTAVSGWVYYCGLTGEDISFFEFLRGPFANGFELWPCGWRAHTEKWNAYENVIKVQYERLCGSIALRLARLGWNIADFFDSDCARYAAVLSRNVKMRRSYVTDKMVPLGVSEWSKICNDDSIHFLKRYVGDIMERLDYKWNKP